ncbi:endolytic transglycosylase MltG [Endozoicomonas sp. SM1973]|uniref:Endolytic murein transglycosylase n=1 Tax=Spartinivicinus marinus TaxID=2994442 RepID=A0A853I730_9GAMM|nr:endolytic transglycosylase MltG [Spartinivicinus marinus]MCX4029441.1 endolytic transglycosylase MltG [Spartinivicinus marinus]NYZ65015.1 endolytic transglycosylase MltG [Spartinivicinus marinus]
MRTFIFKTITLLLFLAGIALVAAAWALIYGVDMYGQQPLKAQQQTTLTIASGSSVKQIAQQLKSQGLVEYDWLFALYIRAKGKAQQLKAGEFELQASANHQDLLNTLVNGKQRQYSITLVEGWNVRQMLRAITKHPQITHTLPVSVDQESLLEALGQTSKHAEGLFFPDTYFFTAGMSDKDLLLRAYRKMDKVLTTEWQQRKEGLPYQSPYEVLIMASIVEKETGAAGERPQIAGVFTRRLEKGMRLQTDPTVIYGLGDKYQGNLTRKHLRQPTPYNTYTIKGLPPTPIALPGKAAIDAVLNPAPGKSLYFVAKGDGSHYFSATLKEHNRAVRKYQLNRRDNYRSQPVNN